MLHKGTVERATFELLIQLMQDEKLKKFNLAGGTALALYLGHRKSIDLDFFIQDDFDAKSLEEYLINRYNFKTSFLEKNTLKGFVEYIKIDCITHNYPRLEQFFQSKEGIRLYGIKDIAAMKLSAITDNGTRIKDFIDIAYLSTKFSLSEMLNAYEIKYSNSNSIIPLKGIIYFNDINFKEPIQMINDTFKWEFVEKRLYEMTQKTNTVFPGIIFE